MGSVDMLTPSLPTFVLSSTYDPPSSRTWSRTRSFSAPPTIENGIPPTTASIYNTTLPPTSVNVNRPHLSFPPYTASRQLINLLNTPNNNVNDPRMFSSLVNPFHPLHPTDHPRPSVSVPVRGPSDPYGPSHPALGTPILIPLPVPPFDPYGTLTNSGQVSEQAPGVLEELKAVQGTPSTRHKVLPWVEMTQGQEFEDTPGLFGPYDSQPPTRPGTRDPTLVDSTIPHPPARSNHPFAYTPINTVPFSVLGPPNNGNGIIDATAALAEQDRMRNRESEVLSRGAGMRVSSQPQAPLVGVVEGELTPGKTGSAVSAGMGTFGREPSVEPVPIPAGIPWGGQVKGSPTKTASSPRKPVPSQTPRTPGPAPTQPLPPPPKTPSAPARPRTTGPQVDTQSQAGPHVHHPHPEHPFDVGEAARKQAEAMQAARAEALAQLEAATRTSPQAPDTRQTAIGQLVPEGLGTGQKGPRQTYETSTSGPSFGHLLHQDGRPITGRFSAQPEPPNPASRGSVGIGGAGAFFRIPFGVPLGLGVPRPLMVMRSDTGLGMGLGLTPQGVQQEARHIGEVVDKVELDRKSRSAFVESIADEEEPVNPNARSPSVPPKTTERAIQKAPTQADEIAFDPARASSQILLTRPPSGVIPEGSNQPLNMPHSRAPTTGAPLPHISEVPTYQPAPPTGTVKSVRLPSGANTIIPAPTVASTIHAPQPDSASLLQGGGSVINGNYSPYAPSVAPTTTSNVHRLVAESKFHDETLCQLLDAARLNLIGDEAKKALNRAARARVIELKDMRVRGEMPPEPVIPDVNERDKKSKSKRSKSRDSHTHRKVSGRTERNVSGRKAENDSPPQWAQEIMNRLGAFESRFSELEKNDPTIRGEITPAQMQDPLGDLVRHLILHDLSGSPGEPMMTIPSYLMDQPRASIHTIQPTAPPTVGSRGRQSEHQVQQSIQGTIPQPGVSQNGTVHQQSLHQSQTQTQTQSPHTIPVTHVPTTPGTHKQSTTPGTNPQISGRGMTLNADPSGELLTWGSDVEFPEPGESVPPPRPKTGMAPPSIFIQAPTDSNMGKSMGVSVTPSARGTALPAQEIQTTPGGVDQDVDSDHQTHKTHQTQQTQKTHHTALPDPLQRDLPPVPSESIRSHRSSPAQMSNEGYPPLPPSTAHEQGQSMKDSSKAFSGKTVGGQGWQANTPSMTKTVPIQQSQIGKTASVARTVPPGMMYIPGLAPLGEVLGQTHPGVDPMGGMSTVPQQVTDMENGINQQQQSNIPRDSHDYSSPTFHTAPQPGETQQQQEKDMIHIYDPEQLQQAPSSGGGGGVIPPWDLITQRLYSWALVWEDESFVRALENVSLGKQVEEFPLTVFTMMTFKRLLRHNLSSTPPKNCDKLFVPPAMADAINNAVHGKHFTLAQQILEELWYPFGFNDPPRIIIALSKHRQEPDHWTAHRFDLTNGHLTSYVVRTPLAGQAAMHDGRPFMWWHAIRLAWPQYDIPPPENMRQRTEVFDRPVEVKGDNSLLASNIARNLLLGYRPERQTDLNKMRELVWTEVKRLLQKKRTGRLALDMDSSEHVYEL
ncbi:hypothetical protein M231_04551 [Tremella mesenterica]|uniref:Uncharacterized protein n=1 Tax=Tremella mesenterica TaxID=5217 RepID=A0A4V1M3V4_TREME|nr:hypothetical protein M231_04551 [Tremella mesenterica]